MHSKFIRNGLSVFTIENSGKEHGATCRLTATAIAAVFIPRLDERAWHRAIGTIDTAITGFRLKHSVALLAFVEPLAGVRGHGLRLDMAARGTSQRGFKNDRAHEAFLSITAADASLNRRSGTHHR